MAHKKIGSFTVGNVCVKTYRDSEWDQYICKPFIDGRVQPEVNWYFTHGAQHSGSDGTESEAINSPT